MLALIPDEDLRKEIAARMPKGSDSVNRWNIMNEVIKKYFDSKSEKNRKTTNNILKEIILQFSYPRLDINVSKGLNHLLKSPFVVHPKTGSCIQL